MTHFTDEKTGAEDPSDYNVGKYEVQNHGGSESHVLAI